ncbi:MAG: hypothetical protein IT267_11480 [Saprospiraceae bacterium]|nr:hypothetical protein [Saprospiraceae bacterium]
MNQLIVEAGTSKSDWCLINREKLVFEFTTAGINPTTQGKSNILSIIEIAKQNLKSHSIHAINFYGAGCKGMGQVVIRELLEYCFNLQNIQAESDLLAAARSSCGAKKGIVAIIGTGSHSCLSDGHQIIDQKPSLGYLLGDEGSGNYYGKKILTAYFYSELSRELIELLESEFPFIQQDYLSALYSNPRISYELAQFFPFLIRHKHNNHIQEIIQEGIAEFYKQRIKNYEDQSSFPLYIVGNVGNALKEEYLAYLLEKGFYIVHFNPRPIEGLIQYHTQYV